MGRNFGIDFDLTCLDLLPKFDQDEIGKIIQLCTSEAQENLENKEKLLKLIAAIDLTTLSGDDTTARVQKLFNRALKPLSAETLCSLPNSLQDSASQRVHCAAVCTYPARVLDVVAEKKRRDFDDFVHVASVAGGFPSGQYKLETRVREVELAVQDGATEIDIVINRCAALEGDWKTVYDEVKAMRDACGDAHLKTILATGELESLENIYKASMVSMMAGSDFIKTSTGKETVNATLPAAYVMCTAIKAYFDKTGNMVGFKAAGGIKTAEQALSYEVLVDKLLGSDWLNPGFFRIGASTLLDNIEKLLKQ